MLTMVSKKHVNILSGFKQDGKKSTSEGNMKHLKLGKIQWLALLVVSAMFANLCSQMVVSAAESNQSTEVATTAAKKNNKGKRGRIQSILVFLL